MCVTHISIDIFTDMLFLEASIDAKNVLLCSRGIFCLTLIAVSKSEQLRVIVYADSKIPLKEVS